jgi:hypothetical protein
MVVGLELLRLSRIKYHYAISTLNKIYYVCYDISVCRLVSNFEPLNRFQRNLIGDVINQR